MPDQSFLTLKHAVIFAKSIRLHSNIYPIITHFDAFETHFQNIMVNGAFAPMLHFPKCLKKYSKPNLNFSSFLSMLSKNEK